MAIIRVFLKKLFLSKQKTNMPHLQRKFLKPQRSSPFAFKRTVFLVTKTREREMDQPVYTEKDKTQTKQKQINF